MTDPNNQDTPVAIYRGNGLIDCGDTGHHNIELLKLIPANTSLYSSDQLDRMRERAERAEAALRPFSEAAQNAEVSGQPPFYFCDARDYENARAVLNKKQETSHE